MLEMTGKILIVVCLCYWQQGVQGAVDFQKCNVGDNECVKQSAAAFAPTFLNGIPEFGIEVLDPMKFKTLNASDKDLLLVLKDITVTGLRQCKFQKLKRDTKKEKILLDLLCDVDIAGSYEMTGRLLVLPMEGNGALTVNLKKLLVKIDADVPVKTAADGKPHWIISNWKFDFDLKAPSKVFFANLYPGNELLGQAARELVKTNGNDIIFAVGRPVLKTIIKKIVDNVEKFFKGIPAEELMNES